MKNDFKKIPFPRTLKYSSNSEHIPLEFYSETFPRAKTIDLLLGYFSSNAITTLATSFAEFIYKGGKMRIITNHYYALKDKEELFDHSNLNPDDWVLRIENLEELAKTFSNRDQHFFDCLKYLLKEGRLQIQPVKFNKVDLAHSKEMILSDGENWISTDGSINFTTAAIVSNSESFDVNVSWKENDVFDERITEAREKFHQIISGKHPKYRLLDPSELEVVIQKIGNNKELDELIEDSIKLDTKSDYSIRVKDLLEKKKDRFNYMIADLKGLPRFPFPDGPRDYQKDAYNEWVKNNHSGIFAMATGTGKTITSLNCLLREYQKTKNFQAIILVPTVILLKQWETECRNFNFNTIVTTADENWSNQLSRLILLTSNNQKVDYVFISTYASFNGKKCQSILGSKNLDSVIFIADESHNLGSARTKTHLPIGIKKRIGLSATPNRQYDFAGTKAIEDFFDSRAPSYTFSYPMKKAIDDEFLCKYEYHPYFATLEWDELEAYKELSIKLLKHFDFKKGVYKESAEHLLIARKRIIHQAVNKKVVFKKVLNNLTTMVDGVLKHTLVYVPEGYEHDYSKSNDYDVKLEDQRIIDDYSQIIAESSLTTHQVLGETQDREKILKQFENGKISILTAMKTLDEGVDIPATKYAIFCSSTGNPRQFVQRRGRILRNFEGKEKAYVYDIVIKPNLELLQDISPKIREQIRKMEINIFRGEIYRVANFLYASENRNELSTNTNSNFIELRNLAEQFDINLDGLINDLDELDK